MVKIILEKFRKLSNKEKCKRYKDMSNEDKYIFRLTDPAPFITVGTIGYMKVTEEEKKEAIERIKKVKKRVNKRLEELAKGDCNQN